MGMTVRRSRSALVALLLGGVVLAGCSGGGGDDGSTGTVDQSELAVAPEGDPNAGVAEDEARAETTAGTSAEQVSVLEDRSVIYRVSVVLEVDDVEATATEIAALATRYDGYVQSESTSGTGVDSPAASEPLTTDEFGVVPPVPPIPPFPPTGTSAVLVLRVPAATYTEAVDEIESLGETVSRTRTADDVTEQVVDVETRIETQEASIDRLQQLLSEASDIADVLAIETELTRRIADLESLQAQLEQLSTLTELATLTVTLYPPETVVEEGTGFVAGLRAGWDAFVRTVELSLTALGAALPFVAAFALVIVPVTVWLVVRHRRSRAAEPPPGAGPSDAEPDASAGNAADDAFASPERDR